MRNVLGVGVWVRLADLEAVCCSTAFLVGVGIFLGVCRRM